MSYMDFVAAADVSNMKAGGSSFMEDPLTAIGTTVAGAVVSGVGSIYNTGVDVSNKVFGTNAERLDTGHVLNSIDTKWGDYYEENKDTIDTLGFIGTSFVPGGLAVKGLKLAREGQVFGSFSRVLGFASSKQAYYTEKALEGIAEAGGSVFTQINKNKLAAMAYGAADQALQAFTFETATAITMKAAPMLDAADVKDIGWDILKTSAVGGVLGGGIEALFTNRMLKDAAKLVDAKKRDYDILSNLGNTSAGLGDKIFSISDSLLKLPPEVLDEATKIPFDKFKAGYSLDTKSLLNRTLRNAKNQGLQDFEAAITKVVANDYSVGTPLAKSFAGIVKQGMEAGETSDSIRRRLGDYLFNLESVEAIGTRTANFGEDVIYLHPKAKLTDKTVEWGTLPENAEGIKAYRLIGDHKDARTATLGEKGLTRISDAFEQGIDVVIDPAAGGTVHVNPNSTVYKQISTREAEQNSVYLNTKTNKTADTAVPTIADVARTGEEVTVKADMVAAGNRTFKFTTQEASPATDSVEATARHLWASKVTKVTGSIEATDVSMMDKLLQTPGIADPELKIFIPGRGSVRYADISNFEEFAFAQKLERAQEMVKKAGPMADLRETAYKLNVTPEWLETAITRKWDKSLYNEAGWTRPLAEYGERENLILRYNTANLETATVNSDALTAYKVRVKEAVDKCEANARAVLGGKVHDQLIRLETSITKDTNEVGSGASLLGAANADYFDKAAVWAQHTGTVVAKAIQDRVETALSSIQTHAARLLKNTDASAEVAALTTRIRTSTEGLALYKDPVTGKGLVVDLESFKTVNSDHFKGFTTRIELSEDAFKFMEQHHTLHQERVAQYQTLAAAQGVSNTWNPARLYVPPVDTQRVPFFAFVRQADGTIFGSSEVGMITARDAAELKRLTDGIEKDPTLRVIFKADTEAYHKAKGDYDFQRTLNEPMIDSMLRKKGKLGDYLPSFTPQDTVEEYIRYIQRQETKIVRDAVSVNYAQTFTELQSLSNRATASQTSKMEGLGKLFTRNIVDPFGDYLKTAMNISKRGEFTLWHQMNEFVDALGTRAYRGIEQATMDAKDGKITWQQANDKLEQFGVGAHFKDKDMFDLAQTSGDRNLIKIAMNKANMLLANGLLRLDFANSLMNMVSTPILLGTEVAAIRKSLKNDPEMFAVFNQNLSQQVPGMQVSVPSATKLLFKAIANSFGDEGKFLRTRYAEIGAIKDQKSIFHDMIDDLSLTPKLVPSEWAKKVDGWVEKGASITFNNQAESLTRFVSADVMRQITEPLVQAGRMGKTEQNAFINIFVNRVQGNYLASQRPILFQGTLGSAVGLFQTYQFNLYQQLFRHIENKDMKTLAVMTGLQSSFYGLNGLPLFDAINTHLVGGANINAGHRDMYSMAVQSAGKEMGDWMMYGTASAFPLFSDKSPALYSRGDLNPRNATIIPVSPLDVPAVQAGIKAVSTVVNMGQQIAAGSSLSGALLYGLEHNGLNRPLAGLAQVLSGRVTTSSGALISSSSDMASIATLSRLMGSKPMDESIGLNTVFRNKAYQAMDKARIEDLGTVIKDKMRNKQQLTPDDWIEFQGKYAAAGGRIDGYAAALQRWDKQANTSIVNEAMRHNQTTAGKRLVEVMGGSGLEDYNNPSTFSE